MSDPTEKSSDGLSDRERRREDRRMWKENRNGWSHDYFEDRLFGAFYLILIGCIFLLNTTGVLPWSVWINIIKFWPLFIVSAGIGVILGGSRLLKLIGSIISLVIFLAIVALAIFNPFVNGWSLIPTTVNSQTKTETYSIASSEYSGLASRSFDINIPIGEVNITDSKQNSYLILNTKYYSDSEKLTVNKTAENSILNLDIKNAKSNTFNINTQGPQYNFEVGQSNLPSSFNLKFGAGNAMVNLSDLMVQEFRAEVGAGNLEAKISKDSIPSEGFNLKSGLGNIKLTLPKETGLKINYKVGLGNLTLDGVAVTSGSGSATTTSSNYATSFQKVTLNLEVGLGNIEIVTK